MSLGKIDKTVGGIGGDFEGLTIKQIREKIIAEFHTAYGRYENVSGTMAIEVCHAQDAGVDDEAKVHWVKTEENAILEDEVITREEAIPRLIKAMSIGYQRTAEAITQGDLGKENAKRTALLSALAREGALGVYRNGQQYISVREHSKGLYTVTKGYADCIDSCEPEQTETQVRDLLFDAHGEGYRKEGTVDEFADADEPVNDLMGFVAAPKKLEEVDEESGFNPEWFKNL